jgi:hypothetical protein
MECCDGGSWEWEGKLEKRFCTEWRDTGRPVTCRRNQERWVGWILRGVTCLRVESLCWHSILDAFIIYFLFASCKSTESGWIISTFLSSYPYISVLHHTTTVYLVSSSRNCSIPPFVNCFVKLNYVDPCHRPPLNFPTKASPPLWSLLVPLHPLSLRKSCYPLNFSNLELKTSWLCGIFLTLFVKCMLRA